MEVKLCTYNDDPRRVGKNPTVVKTLQMNPVTITNLMNPVFTCDYDSSIILCNYAIVQDFNRKYFVNPPDLIKGGRLQFTFHVDVLECGWLGCKGTVIRNQYKRRLRAILDELILDKSVSYDVFIIAKKPILEIDYEETKKQLSFLLKKLNLTK